MTSVLPRFFDSFAFRLTAVLSLMLAWSAPAYCGDIQKAARKGDLEEVKRLLKGNPDLVFNKDDDGWTPLHLAAANGHQELVEFLLASKAEVNAKDINGSTPLHQAAAAKGHHQDLMKMLLAHGAEVNARDKFGLTPLHWATMHDAQDVVEFLLANRADVNAKDIAAGDTPLIIAAEMGFMDEVKVLLAHGAEVNARDNQGTALAWAAQTGHNDVADFLRHHGGHE